MHAAKKKKAHTPSGRFEEDGGQDGTRSIKTWHMYYLRAKRSYSCERQPEEKGGLLGRAKLEILHTMNPYDLDLSG